MKLARIQKSTGLNLTGIQQESGVGAYDFGPEKAKDAIDFHRSLGGYAPTPLKRMEAQASLLGIKDIFVKDESPRFGLNSFKALGGTYAIHKVLEQNPNVDTFVTTTDGNHGRGVAWAARELGKKAIVYMPKGTSPARLDHILKLGADAKITDMSYDDCVKYTASLAREKGYALIQDTAWEGYEEIPSYIMAGYTTMGAEILSQLAKENANPPITHIFLQAGVGSMAAAMAGFFREAFSKYNPKIVIVEPDGAACFYETALAGDGKRHFCKDLNTIMAGLSCGEPSTIAWDIIAKSADYALCVPDSTTITGMRAYAHPVGGDEPVISGESGAVTYGALIEILSNESLWDIREALDLNKKSSVLVISTEGDTDHENYVKIIS